MAPVQTSAAVRVWFAAADYQQLELLQNSSVLVQAYFFWVPCVNKALDEHTAAADSLNTAWGGVTATISKEMFTAAWW